MTFMHWTVLPSESPAGGNDFSDCASPDATSMSRLERLYQKHINCVVRYCLRQVGRWDVAEDIASDVFLILHQNLDSVADQQLPAWLFTVARNKAVDYWRHQAVAFRHEPSQPEPPALLEPALSFEEILQGNRSLKPIHRICLTLRYLHGLSRAEMARYTGLSETRIKGHLQYALRLLRHSFLQTSSATIASCGRSTES